VRTLTNILLGICLATLFGTVVSRAQADEEDKKTTVTFNEAVAIPGRDLAAGTYVFTLEKSDSDRNMVQIWTGDDMHLLATVLTVPSYRIDPTNKTVITFDEGRRGSPMEIKSWFFPGDLIGQEFLYSNDYR
jgi:hypothetical protein